MLILGMGIYIEITFLHIIFFLLFILFINYIIGIDWIIKLYRAEIIILYINRETGKHNIIKY